MKLSCFWSDHFWFPANTTWADLDGRNGVDYAHPKDFWIQIPLVPFVLILRFLCERYIFKPIGEHLKISKYKRKAPPNPDLELLYKLFHKNNMSLQKYLTNRENQRWFRLRGNQDSPTTLNKFCENMWKGCHYLFNTSYGLYVLWNNRWAWHPQMYFQEFPRQGVTPELRRYYMLATAFYLSLTITQFRDVRRKDFTQMFVHHAITVSLLYLSWCSQTFRVGCLITVLSDSSDVFLELGKAAKYAKFHKLVDCVFVVFVGVWVMTRLVLLPVFVYPSLFNQTMKTPFLVVVSMTMMMSIVLSLTLYWTWLILKLVVKALKDGQVKKDVRSSESEDSEPTANDLKRKNK